MRLWKDRPLEFRRLPRPAAVGGYFNPADSPCTGPSEACDLVESLGSNPLSAGGARDYRIRSQFKLEPAGFAIGIFAGLHNSLVRVGFPLLKVGPVHHLDSSQKFHT